MACIVDDVTLGKPLARGNLKTSAATTIAGAVTRNAKEQRILAKTCESKRTVTKKKKKPLLCSKSSDD